MEPYRHIGPSSSRQLQGCLGFATVGLQSIMQEQRTLYAAPIRPEVLMWAPWVVQSSRRAHVRFCGNRLLPDLAASCLPMLLIVATAILLQKSRLIFNHLLIQSS